VIGDNWAVEPLITALSDEGLRDSAVVALDTNRIDIQWVFIELAQRGVG
jgi:hypothetical protein